MQELKQKQSFSLQSRFCRSQIRIVYSTPGVLLIRSACVNIIRGTRQPVHNRVIAQSFRFLGRAAEFAFALLLKMISASANTLLQTLADYVLCQLLRNALFNSFAIWVDQIVDSEKNKNKKQKNFQKNSLNSGKFIQTNAINRNFIGFGLNNRRVNI